MPFSFSQELFLVLVIALIGGVVAKILRLQPIIGYTVGGIVSSALFPVNALSVDRLAEVGTILLLFSIGVELSWARLARVFKVAVAGGILQMILVTGLLYLILTGLGIHGTSAVILAAGFSLSSTALVVKILSDRGETDTIHGEIMVGWLLVQDLAVIPMMIILNALGRSSGNIVGDGVQALLTSGLVVVATIVLGNLIAPFFIHKVASFNSRELLVLSAMALALGTAALTSFFGISPALGAFLAGVVISKSQENQAIFAEIRPLRDIFVALFFVTLGFFVTPAVVVANFGLIILLVAVILAAKFAVILLISLAFGYHGKTAVATGVGLAQVGEFSFILFSQAKVLNLISGDLASVGIAASLLTIIITPLLFKSIVPFWRSLRNLTQRQPFLAKAFVGWDKANHAQAKVFTDHIIICGYGRVGGWVGRALRGLSVPFVVVDYNQRVVTSLKESGEDVIYGDPSEPEVLEVAGIKAARAIVIAIPDRVAQETLVTHVQSVAPGVKIITRAHFDEDWEKLTALRVDKIVQPEFEAAVAIIKTIMASMGRGREETDLTIKGLRQSHTKSI